MVTRTFLWVDADRLLVDGVVFDLDLNDVSRWKSTASYYLFVGLEQTGFGLGIRSSGQNSVLDRVELGAGTGQELRSFVGEVNYLVAVPDGPTVSAEAAAFVPEPPAVWPPGSDQPEEPIPAPVVTTMLPDLGVADQPLLEQLHAVATEARGDGDRILLEVAQLGSGETMTVSQDDIDGCSGVGFAAGAISSQALGHAIVDGISVIIYTYSHAVDSVTVAAVDPNNCDIVVVVGSLLTPGPGVNITTTVAG